MHKEKFEYKVLKVAAIVSAIVFIILLTLIPIDYSLSIGWLAGTTTVIVSYSIGILLINKFFKKKKSKSLGFFVGWARFYINLFITAGCFIAVMAIDKSVNGYSLFEGSIESLYKPINIFTYLGGISLIFISTLVAQFLSRKEEKKDVTKNK